MLRDSDGCPDERVSGLKVRCDQKGMMRLLTGIRLKLVVVVVVTRCSTNHRIETGSRIMDHTISEDTDGASSHFASSSYSFKSYSTTFNIVYCIQYNETRFIIHWNFFSSLGFFCFF